LATEGRGIGIAVEGVAAEAAVGAGVLVASSDGKERDDRNPKAFHGTFDAAAQGVFTPWIALKGTQFR